LVERATTNLWADAAARLRTKSSRIFSPGSEASSIRMNSHVRCSAASECSTEARQADVSAALPRAGMMMLSKMPPCLP